MPTLTADGVLTEPRHHWLKAEIQSGRCTEVSAMLMRDIADPWEVDYFFLTILRWKYDKATRRFDTGASPSCSK